VRPNQYGDCDYSAADLARQPFPGLGDFLLSYGNYGHSRSMLSRQSSSTAIRMGLLLNLAYTYLRQNSTGIDSGNSSLGGVAYDSSIRKSTTPRSRLYRPAALSPTAFTICR